MGLFRKRRAPVPEQLGDAGYSMLAAGITVFGDIETDGTLRIDGRLEGSVRRAGMVLLGTDAVVRGNVAAREVVVGGSIEGNLSAADRVELQATAMVTGDIDAGAILVHEGGVVRGRLGIKSRNIDAPQKERRPVTPTPRGAPVLVGQNAGEAS